MECPSCGNQLRIGESFISVENDKTPDKPTEVYTNLPMICINTICDNYGGTDLSHPQKVVEIVKNKIYGDG